MVYGTDYTFEDRADQDRKALTNKALSYRNNLAGTQSSAYDLARENAYGDLQGQQDKITSGASSRGLLYSGLKQGEDASAQNATAQSLAQRRQQINRGTEDEAFRQSTLANTANQSWNELQQQKALGSYNIGLQDQANQMQLMKGIFGAAGVAGGGALAKSDPSSTSSSVKTDSGNS